MAKFTPFTAHIKVTPARPGKRLEMIRDLEKIAVFAYDALDGVSGIQLAYPGGSQQRSYNRFSGLSSGLAAKPQFGQTPAMIVIEGFYTVSSENIQPHPDESLINAGALVTRAGGAHLYDANPTTTIATEVQTLRALLISSLNAGLPDTIVYEIRRIDYANVVWGIGGIHFPH